MPDGNTGTALTRAQEFDLQLEEQARNLKIMLPAHVPVEKFKRVVVTAVIQDPKLFNADRRSLFMAAQKCASDGLLPDGREAVLLAFNTRVKEKLPDGTQRDAFKDIVTYIPMLQGIRTRLRNTGLVASAEAHVVHRNDKFFQKFGSDPQIVHEPPALGTPRGEPVGAYAIIRLVSGEVIQEVMDKDEIERVRSFSKNKDGPAWKGHWGEMARKTTLKRAAKSAPTSAEMLQIFDRDEEEIAAPGMVDVTGAEYEPEPQRQLVEPESGPSYLLIDADGEEHEYAAPATVENALGIVLKDAKQRGRAALEAAAENNRATIALLPVEYAERITALWREMATDADPFGLPPLDNHSPPAQQQERSATGGLGGPAPAGEPEQPADLLGDPAPENLTVPLPPRPTAGQLDHFARQMLHMIGEKPKTAQRLAQIQQQNRHEIGLLKTGTPELYDELMAALASKVAG